MKILARSFFSTMLLLSTSPFLHADTLAYALGGTGNTGILGTVDLSTGTFMQISSSQPLPYIRGVGEFNGALYGEGNNVQNTTFYKIDPNNATAIAIGSAGSGISLASWFGSTTTGLYALSSDPTGALLYSINPSTGAATLIGPTGVNLTYSSFGASTGGLSVGADELYMNISTADPLTSRFFSINTTTGLATLIGQSSPGTCLQAMAFINDNLYSSSGYCVNGTNYYSMDVSNGQPSFLSQANSSVDLFDLAPLLNSTSPEPSTTGIVVFGGILLISYVAIRRLCLSSF